MRNISVLLAESVSFTKNGKQLSPAAITELLHTPLFSVVLEGDMRSVTKWTFSESEKKLPSISFHRCADVYFFDYLLKRDEPLVLTEAEVTNTFKKIAGSKTDNTIVFATNSSKALMQMVNATNRNCKITQLLDEDDDTYTLYSFS